MWNYKEWVHAHGTFTNAVVFDITQGFIYGHVDAFARSIPAGKNLGVPQARDSVIASEISWAMLNDAHRQYPADPKHEDMQQILETNYSGANAPYARSTLALFPPHRHPITLSHLFINTYEPARGYLPSAEPALPRFAPLSPPFPLDSEHRFP